MGSFAVPLSGLGASSDELNVIGNNLANLNTDGFKDQGLTFGDIFAQAQATSGNGDPIQIGSGVQVESTTSNFTNGSVNATGASANMALQGNGFFVVSGNGETSYTRNGAFSVNSLGQITTAGGQLVMGYPAVNGVVSTSGNLVPITVNQTGTIPAVATTSFQTVTNLNAGAGVGSAPFNTPITVYDSLGTAQNLNIQYTNTGPNTWTYTVSMAPQTVSAATTTAAGVTASTYNFGTSGGTVATVDPSTNLTITGQTAGGTTATIVAPAITAGETVANYATALQAAVTAAGITGVTVTSNAGGQLTISGTNMTTSGSVAQDAISANTTGTLTFNANGTLVSPTGSISGISFSALADGSSPMNLTWNLDGSSGTPLITQQASASANTTSPIQNGYGVGTMSGYTVEADGTVQGQFSNGQTLALGQVVVANFANVQGLTQGADGNEQATTASGAAVIGQAGVGGNGTITGGAVEGSNVNLSTEFANMIVAQQSYEANAKVLTTLNQVSQATIQLVQ